MIVAKGADCLSRLHTKHCYVGIVHRIVIVSINKSMYTLYKNLSKVCIEQHLEAFATRLTYTKFFGDIGNLT